MADMERARLLSRLQIEAIYLGKRFGAVNYDQEDGTWLQIVRFSIDSGWNKSHVSLLLDVPTGYPQVAPKWFWTDIDLKTDRGTDIKHFFTAGSSHVDLQHRDKGWGHFCIHVQSWHPAPGRNLTQGDSLLTFVELIRTVFYDRQYLAQ
jgi:hypothetical protein